MDLTEFYAPPVAMTTKGHTPMTPERRAELLALADGAPLTFHPDTAATAFADGEIAAGRAFPAEKHALIAAFKNAVADDRSAPRTVTFADAEGKEQTGSRVDALRARQGLRTPHGPTPVTMSDERKKKLLAMTGVAEPPVRIVAQGNAR